MKGVLSEKVPTITTWNGRDIRELSRDELLVALDQSARELSAAYRLGASTAEFYDCLPGTQRRLKMIDWDNTRQGYDAGSSASGYTQAANQYAHNAKAQAAGTINADALQKHAGTILGSKASRVESEQALIQIQRRLDMLQEQLTYSLGTLNETANRIFGSIPEANEAQNARVAPDCAIAYMYGQIDRLAETGADISRVTDRLARL